MIVSDDGSVVIRGPFTHVNGVPQPGICRLDASGELDETFHPDPGAENWMPRLRLRSGLWLGALTDQPEFTSPANSTGIAAEIRFSIDGKLDRSFQFSGVAFGTSLAEAPDGTVLVGGDLDGSPFIYRIGLDGSLVQRIDLHGFVVDSKYINGIFVRPDGRFLVTGLMPPSRDLLVKQFHPDGSPDEAFTTIKGRSLALLSDGRIAIEDGPYEMSLYLVSGTREPSWPKTIFAGCDQAGTASLPPRFVAATGARLDVMFLTFCQTCNGTPAPGIENDVEPKQLSFFLKDSPKTSLELTAFRRVQLDLSTEIVQSRFSGFEGFDELFPDPIGRFAFPIVFRRHGPTTSAAAVHYTTRDITATAGKDYVAQSGTLNFVPLEVEKTIFIPVIIDGEDEFDETLEVVVTGAEGFEASPAPLRLTILDKANRGRAPRLERIKRLRDGRVPLGGFAQPNGSLGPKAKIEYSADLKTWQPLMNIFGDPNYDSSLWLAASATNASTRFYRAVAR